MAADTFGITKLYDTKSGGREWFSNWHNSTSRAFRHTSSYTIPVNTAGINQDPQDNQFISLGAGTSAWFIDGTSGIATWRQQTEGTGDIRAYMGLDYPAGGTFQPYEISSQDPARLTWQNVEMTGYVRLWKVASGITPTVTRLAVRSNHYNIQNCNCDALGYDFQFEIDAGSQYAMRLGKEIIHDVYTSPADEVNVARSHFVTMPSYSRFANMQRVPMLRWVGMKFVVRTITSSGHVRLEGYRDMSNGLNGGQWIKMAQLDDDGIDMHWGAISSGKRTQLDDFWNSTGGCGNNPTNCVESHTAIQGNYNPIITRAGYGCYYRTDGCVKVELKKFSVREIDPL